MDAFANTDCRTDSESFVWMNGRMIPQKEAAIAATDFGFQYGYGIFETLRVEKAKPCFLNDHLERFNHSWQELFNQEPPDVTWDVIIEQVIHRNRLDQITASVKILASMGRNQGPPHDHTLLVMARPYIHRLDGKRDQGLYLLTYPEPRETPLAAHKSMNYLYYFLAGKWAQTHGADEAVILNPDKTVSETNTGNILAITGNKALCPVSPHVLPGTMQKEVKKILMEWGYVWVKNPVLQKDLFGADMVLVTNALMGAVPAIRIDGKAMPKPSDLWEKINRTVFDN